MKINEKHPATRRSFWGKIIALLACCLLLVSCQPQNQATNNQAQVKLTRVVSGQTIEVVGIGGQSNLISQVRLIGLDAPDLKQTPWGREAKELLEHLIGGRDQPITIEFDIQRKDRLDRILAYIWKDKTLLNEELIKQGYALFVDRSPNEKYHRRLETAQHWARIMGKGIWNPEQPMTLTPREFRQENLY